MCSLAAGIVRVIGAVSKPAALCFLLGWRMAINDVLRNQQSQPHSGCGLVNLNMASCMKMQIKGDTLCISDVKELGAANSNAFRDQARSTMTASQKNIEIDLSPTTCLDSCGLGALIALHKTVCGRKGLVRLINPIPPVRQILELTRMHRLFEIVKP
jgi:anti-sigma B factor antagonist